MPDNTSTPASGGAPQQGSAPAPLAPPMVVHVSSAEKNSYVMRLMNEYGGAENALARVAGKVLQYQKRAQEAERQTADALKLVPPKDAVVLTGDEAKAFKTLQERKVELAKVPGLLDDAAKLAATATADLRKTAIREAAGDKYKEKVLALLIGDKALELRDALVKGEDGKMKTEKVAYIKIGDTVEPLDAWIEREHADSLDVLKADPNAAQNSAGGTQNGGTEMPPQRGTQPPTRGNTTSTNAGIVDSVLSSRYETPAMRREAERKHA